MSEPFLAEIRIFAGNFAPRGWSFCNGQLLPVAQNTALFSLLGTTFGGDGRQTLGLPNLQGRAAMHPGRGPGLTARRLGEKGGAETETLTAAQTPQHDHTLTAVQNQAAVKVPSNTVGIARTRFGQAYQQDASSNLQNMSADAVSSVGGGQAHNNMQPYLAMYFIIALVGQYPARS